MTAKDISISGNIWHHQDKPGKDPALEPLSAETEGEGMATQREPAEFLSFAIQCAEK
jgi:hypothetical protein